MFYQKTTRYRLRFITEHFRLFLGYFFPLCSLLPCPGFLAVYTLYNGSNGCSNLGQELACDNIQLFNPPGSATFLDLIAPYRSTGGA